MNLRNLVSVRPAGAASPRSMTEDGSASKGVLMTSAALVTFPGATLAARVILAVLGQVSPGLGNSTIAAIVVSFVVGGLIYLIGYKGAATIKEQAINAAIAIVNCFFIAAGVLGIDEIVAQ